MVTPRSQQRFADTWGIISLGGFDLTIRTLVLALGTLILCFSTLAQSGTQAIIALALNLASVAVMLLVTKATRTVGIRLLVFCFFGGAAMLGSAIAIGNVVSISLSFDPSRGAASSPLRSFVLPLIEDICRLMPVIVILTVGRKFTAKTMGASDFLLLGIASGAGFALAEDACIHAAQGWNNPYFWLPATVCVNNHLVAGHALWSALACGTLGLGLLLRHRKQLALPLMAGGFLWAAVDHIAMDYSIAHTDTAAGILTFLSANGYLTILLFLATVAAAIFLDLSIILRSTPPFPEFALFSQSERSQGIGQAWQYVLDRRRLAFALHRRAHTANPQQLCLVSAILAQCLINYRHGVNVSPAKPTKALRQDAALPPDFASSQDSARRMQESLPQSLGLAPTDKAPPTTADLASSLSNGPITSPMIGPVASRSTGLAPGLAQSLAKGLAKGPPPTSILPPSTGDANRNKPNSEDRMPSNNPLVESAAQAAFDRQIPPHDPTLVSAGTLANQNPEDSSYGEQLMQEIRLPGQYVLLSRISEGGMGVIFSATHRHTGAKLAIKVLHPHISKIAVNVLRFEQEAKAACAMNHPNLVVVHDFGLTIDSIPYLVMDLIEGESLQKLVRSNGPMPTRMFLETFVQAADAIAHAHKRGVIHRDVKPSNILITVDDKGQDSVRIVDFGIAKINGDGQRGQDLTATGDLVGSPLYMSPEQCLGNTLDARSDLYSLGCTMYFAATGREPFLGKNAVQTIFKHLHDMPARPTEIHPGIPEEVEMIIFKLLQKDPRQRFASAEELKTALEHAREMCLANGNWV